MRPAKRHSAPTLVLLYLHRDRGLTVLFMTSHRSCKELSLDINELHGIIVLEANVRYVMMVMMRVGQSVM